jgi:prepilin-type N-terminal cleavage/methylation domain-containing protein
MKKSKRKWNQKGFTIIESIVALVLVSIMAAMLYTFSEPLYTSLGAFSWFNDELLVQQSMEKILGDYKNQRNDLNNPFDPALFRASVIQNYPLVDATRTGFLTFDATFTASWPPQAAIPGGAQPVLIITVQSHNISLSMIFT